MSYVQLNVDVLRLATCLNGTALAVLMYLSSRADNMGICFPSAKTIVAEIHRKETGVYEALTWLEENNWIAYLRKNEKDRLTGKPMPNIYMINPLLMGIRSNDLEKAKNQYLAVGGRCELPTVQEGSEREGNSAYRRTNQQQNQLQEPTTITNYSNQQQQPAQSPQKAQGQRQKARALTSDLANEELPTSTTAQAQEHGRAAAEPRSKRLIDISGTQPRFIDPVLVYEPLDDAKETVVKQLGGIKIAIPLARGFIVEYGVNAVQQALQITLGAENITRHGGFFRKILQSKLTEVAKEPSMNDPDYYISGKYADFIEH